MKQTPLKRRTPLKRKAPLKSSGRLRPRRKPGARMLPERPRNFAHMARVRALPCIACRRQGMKQTTITEAHHLKRDPETGLVLGGNQKAPDEHTIPLCSFHHREGPRGEAFHKGRGRWEAKHGNEVDLYRETEADLASGAYAAPDCVSWS